MKWKLLNETPETYLLVFDTGDEAAEGITGFAAERHIMAAGISAIGAFSRAAVAYFDLATKEYKEIPVEEQTEVLAINGNLSILDKKPKLHAHAILGKADGSTVGGHLLSGTVRPTLEVIITCYPLEIKREMNKEFGIPLIKLS